jgi:formylglycine-generating enzyme required for sulfatase activity
MARSAFVFVLILSGLGSTVAQAQAPAPKKYALLVGVTTYEHAHLNQPPKIEYPEADAKELSEELGKSGYQVDILLGAKATKVGIKEKLDKLAGQGNEQGVVIVGFFGHGVEYDEKNAEGKPVSRSYFCPYDARMRKRLDGLGREVPDNRGKPRIEPDPATLIAMADVFSAISLSPAGNRVLLADCCRDDPHAARGRSGFGAGLRYNDLPDNANMAALFACSKGEQALEDKQNRHGVFTQCALEWLRQPQAKGTANRLGEYLDESVKDRVATLTDRRQLQTPRCLYIGTVDLQLTPSSSALPKEIVSKSTGMKLVLIPSGTFLMGSSAADVKAAMQADSSFTEEYAKREQPQHSVKISRPFYMGVYEVTQGEYESVMGTNPSRFSKTGSGSSKVSGLDTSKFPVEQVSWFDAVEFCNTLSVQDGLPAYYTLSNVEREGGSIKSATVSTTGGNGYRLPTEAEWEYACRANTTTPFHFGSVLNGDKANIDGNYPFGTTTKGRYLERPTTVGSYAKNAFGLYDLHGNVWEWCFDVFDEKAYSSRGVTTVDPTVTSGSEYRVLRGGSWRVLARNSRSAYRSWSTPDLRNDVSGFRVVR